LWTKRIFFETEEDPKLGKFRVILLKSRPTLITDQIVLNRLNVV